MPAIKELLRIRQGQDSISSLQRDTLKIVIAGCLAILVALLVMSFTSIAITRNAVVYRLKTSDLRNMAGALAATIDGRIDKAVDASLLLANDPMLIRWVQSRDTDEEAGEIVTGKLGELVSGFGYDTAFLTSNLTYHYWSYTGEGFRLLSVMDPGNPADSWFFQTLPMQKKYAINIDPNEVLQETFVWINVLVGDLDDPLAVTGVGLNLSRLIEELVREEAKYQLENDIWLVDGKGIIYLSKDRDHLERPLGDYFPEDLLEKVLGFDRPRRDFQVVEYHDSRGELYDLAYKNIKDTDWQLLVQIPRRESLGFLGAIIQNTVIAGLAIVSLMVGMFFVISARVADPYKRTLQLNQELEEKVQERTRELQEKNQKIQESIDYAQLIQESILPPAAGLRSVFKDYFVLWRPRDTVGGDFYWLKEGREGFLLVVGDCTGHGVPGALMTMAVTSMLEHIVEEHGISSPAKVIQELDRRLGQSFPAPGRDDGFGVGPGLDAAVLFVARDGGLWFSGARLPLIVLDENGIQEIKGNRVTIDGQSPGKIRKIVDRAVTCGQGARLYLLTDGLVDQPGGEKGLPYGRKRLLAGLQSAAHLPLEEQAARVLGSFQGYAGQETTRDDLTLLGFIIK